MSDTFKVFVVADFEPWRVGLVSTIDSAPDMEVVGEATSLEDLVSGEGYRRADVIVLDVEALNRANKQVILGRIGEWVPGLKVLFLGSDHDAEVINPDDLSKYMSLDTTGFLLKDGPSSQLLHAIRMVGSGKFVCETNVIKHILTSLTQWASYSANGRVDQLSDRETEVLTMVAQGHSNKEIALKLFLSEGTVKAHISHIMSKLSLDRRTELVRYVLTKGVVHLPEE